MDAKSLSLIEGLNQRGGRMLSVIDLLEAGTLNLEIASLLLFLMSKNPSFLSCASPGGAGKTALLGALLVHLPKDTKIFSYEKKCPVRENSCVLAHEINKAPCHGYVWGEEARRFFSLASRKKNASVCSTAHADTPEKLKKLLADEHGAGKESLGKLDFLVFINFAARGRKLISLYQAVRGKFIKLYSYDGAKDGWDRGKGFDFSVFGVSGLEFEKAIETAAESLRCLKSNNVRDIYSVRKLL